MAALLIRPGPEPVPVLWICDQSGDLRRYQVSPASVPGMVFACEMPNANGELYRVSQAPGGRFFCTCPDFVCRSKKASGDGCKHSRAVEQHHVGLQIVFLGLERWRKVQAALAG
jgi:hypothetical protein